MGSFRNTSTTVDPFHQTGIRTLRSREWTRSYSEYTVTARKTNGYSFTDFDGVSPGQVHRLPHLFGCLQEYLDRPQGRGVHVVEQCGDQTRHRLSDEVGRPEHL